MSTINLPRDYSPGIQLGLVAVSASQSRPYLQAAGGGSGRQTAACLLVSFGLARTDGVSRGVPAGVVRARDRHPDGPRPAVPGLGSAGRRSWILQRSLYRGLGPGRGPFGRGAPSRFDIWTSERTEGLAMGYTNENENAYRRNPVCGGASTDRVGSTRKRCVRINFEAAAPARDPRSRSFDWDRCCL